VIEYSPFISIFFTIVQKFKPKKKNLSWHVYLNVFNHIVTFWKNYMNFCICWVSESFLKKVVSYLVLYVMNWWQIHIQIQLRMGAHLWRWRRKQNVKRWMWILLQVN
jgi:hypothetical protein